MTTLKNIIKRALRTLVQPYYRLRNTWPVWYYLLNRKGRALYQEHPPVLDAVQQRIVDDLTANGCAVTHISDLFPTNRFGPLAAYADEKMPHARTSTKKRYLLQLLDAVPVLDPRDPLARLAVDDRVLSIVNAYVGVCTRMNHLSLDMTMPVEPGTRPEESQRWHRDPEDRVMCKMFLYLTDVDVTAGPLSYAAGSHRRGKWRGLFPQKPPRGVYPPDGAVEARVPAEDIRTFTGRAGMVVFCDTSGLHRGGYGTAKKRLVATCVYSSDAGFMMDRLSLPSDVRWSDEKLSPQARFATDI